MKMERVDMEERDSFFIGQRVRCINNEYGGVEVGEVGTVMHILHNGMIGVRYDEAYKERHNLRGNCDDRHGWYMFSVCLEPLIEDFGPIGNFALCELSDLLR